MTKHNQNNNKLFAATFDDILQTLAEKYMPKAGYKMFICDGKEALKIIYPFMGYQDSVRLTYAIETILEDEHVFLPSDLHNDAEKLIHDLTTHGQHVRDTADADFPRRQHAPVEKVLLFTQEEHDPKKVNSIYK